MERELITNWREFIDRETIKVISNEIGTSSELVRLWARNGHIPYGENLKKFTSLAHRKLSNRDFKAFIDSLAKDVLGFELSRSAHASNE